MPVVGLQGDKIVTLRVEYNLTDHCNYACDQCSHLSPYMKRRESSLETFTRDLTALAAVMRLRQFIFVGGEPLLHKKILPHIQAVRDSGIAKEVQVSTNGSRIDSTPLEVFSKIDSLNISWYPDARCDSQKIELAREICRRAGTQLAVRKITEFRKMETGRISNERLVDSIYRTCEIAHAYYGQTFYDGRFYLCSRPVFSKNYFDKIGVSAPDFREVDGIPLHAPDLKERLLEALGSTRATAACGYCLGTVGKKVPWRPLQAHERKAPALAPADPLTRINRRRLWFLRLRRIASLDHYLLFMPLFLLFMGRLPMPRSLGRLRKTRRRLAAQPQLGRLATSVRRRS